MRRNRSQNKDYFGSLWYSVETFFKMCFLRGWGEVGGRFLCMGISLPYMYTMYMQCL